MDVYRVTYKVERGVLTEDGFIAAGNDSAPRPTVSAGGQVVIRVDALEAADDTLMELTAESVSNLVYEALTGLEDER